MTTVPVSYSDGRTIDAHIEIWDDNHSERHGMYRAYWTEDGRHGSPVVGYCSPGGSWRTVRECAAEARRLYPGVTILRNGREVTA